ncbi:NUDIX domain-containing protein [Aquimarina agarivorans]|uniref:NUDIX domain-containing protein n=1 Tax=Aquimarina agarivorans TaxID=980584 RepID=UPI00058FFF8A|nr:NUDIX domain-containing protein [Aquimarina agarivorans]
MEKHPEITIKSKETLSKDYYVLNKITIDYKKDDGSTEEQIREVYDKGSGAAILLYNIKKRTVILTRQFRLPIYINEGEKNGMVIEVCAGLLEGLDPESCAKKEALEETGYQIDKVNFLFDAYMTPGAVMEKVSYFTAVYNESMKVASGGGLAEEQENIEVLELDFDIAYNMIAKGEIVDGKSIILLQYACMNIFNKKSH